MQLFLGFDVMPAPTLGVLATDWRLNILFAVISILAVCLYLAAVVRLRRRGDDWPVGRTVTWVAGWVVIVLTTSSGLGRYSTVSFSLHMVLHMSLNMLGPLLLAMGGAVTLALRAIPPRRRTDVAGVHEWLTGILNWSVTRSMYNPLWVFVTFVGSYYLIYLTPLFQEAMRYHWSHQLMNLHFLVGGYLFYSLVIGVDHPPRPLPHIGKLGLVLAAMPFHAFFGVVVMTSSTIIAETFYQYIDAPWMTNLAGDQYLGGGIAWSAGELPLIVVVIALVTQWSKQDSRFAKRTDRHLDSGLDDSFDAYNDMLVRLANRPLGAPAPAPSAPASEPRTPKQKEPR
jgi:putative copper resistance protein D